MQEYDATYHATHWERLNCLIIPRVKLYRDKKEGALVCRCHRTQLSILWESPIGLNYPDRPSKRFPQGNSNIRTYKAMPGCHDVTVYRSEGHETTLKAMNVRTAK